MVKKLIILLLSLWSAGICTGATRIIDENSNEPGIVVALLADEIIMTGGFVEDLRAKDNSKINISGGELGTGFRGYHNSQVTISGGVFGEFIYADNDCQITIFGGHTGNLGAYKNAHIYVYDIDYAQKAEVYEGGYIDIFGGNVKHLLANGGGVITIYGTDFNYDLGKIPHTEFATLSRLTGKFLNGDPINFSFSILGDSSIVLVPEPCSLVLLGLGGLVLLKRKA